MTGQILWHGSAVYEIDMNGCQAFNLKNAVVWQDLLFFYKKKSKKR